MPIVGSPPYDNVGYIIGLAVSISNDAGPNGISGNILNAAQPTTIPLLNKCYRDLQDDLITAGVETYNKYGYVIGLPISNPPNGNPRILTILSYTGYFDGNQWWNGWYLPNDMLKPLEMWECQDGNNYWQPMTQVADAISTRPIMPYFNEWDFQNEQMFLPCVSQSNDLKFKYLCYAPDLTTVNSPVLIARCQTALAYKFLFDVSSGRGGLEMAAIWDQKYKEALAKIVNRSARKELYGNYFRVPFRRRRSARGRNGN